MILLCALVDKVKTKCSQKTQTNRFVEVNKGWTHIFSMWVTFILCKEKKN